MRDLIFWSLFAAMIAGIILTLVGNYRRGQARERSRAELQARLAAEAERAEKVGGVAAKKPEAAAPGPAASPAHDAFDPTKTRLYVDTSHMEAPHEMLSRGAATSPVAGSARLVCLGGRLKGHSFPIPAIGLSVGRAEDNDVVIVDGRVSAHHAWIGMVNGRPMLRDYQSLNGTFLNAEMHSPVSEALLVNGDTIFFGGHGGDQYRFVVD